jgi:hypothetical protein
MQIVNLTTVFRIDICACADMSNRYFVVLRIKLELSQKFGDSRRE